MEIGSFIEMQFPTGKEYYCNNYNKNIARLNSGRAAIYHALKVLNCNTLWLPFYQCETVRNFLNKKSVEVKFYHIDNLFNPVGINQRVNEAVLIVNYFGIMAKKRMENLSSKYKNVIIDNSQAFFCEPMDECMNIYSARKFVGVPDGAYVIGENADRYIKLYKQGFSSDTSLFLLQRIEYGCEGKTYKSKCENEARIDSEDILQMSMLTRKILDGTDYESIKSKRKDNFFDACELFKDINKFNPLIYVDNTCTPMIYPLVVDDDNLVDKLITKKHFQGHWWSYLLDELKQTDFEYWLAKFMVPVTIDQRYDRTNLEYIREIVG